MSLRVGPAGDRLGQLVLGDQLGRLLEVARQGQLLEGWPGTSDLWPNGTPRRLQLGHGPTTASYRVLVADPMYHPLTVAITMPPTVELRVWLETTLGRRVPVLDSTTASGRCRPVNHQSRCQVTLDALHEEEPGVWAVGLAKRSAQPATIRVTVTF
jgi:hypothetical protein